MTGQCCRGQTICKSCLDNWLVTSGTKRCPVCSEAGGSDNTHPNYPIEREVKNLHIYCINKEKGCKWQGELNNINNHLGNNDGCKFEEVKCSNECGKMIERRYLTSHVKTKCPRRKVICQYCHDTVEQEGQHKEECPKLPLPCPNKCEAGSVSREDIEAHRKECPLEMIQCEYHNVGCEVTIARKDMEQHNDQAVKEHLQLTTHKLVAAQKQILNLTMLMHSQLRPTASTGAVYIASAVKWSFTLDSMASMFRLGYQVLPVVVKMVGYNKMKVNDTQWYSDSFYTHNKGYQMCLNIDAAGHGNGKGTHLSVFLYLMEGPHDDELTWPLKEKFRIKLLNQISDSEHRSNILNYQNTDDRDVTHRVTDGDRADGWGKPEFISNEDLHKTTPTRQYFKDDCLFFQVTKL